MRRKHTFWIEGFIFLAFVFSISSCRRTFDFNLEPEENHVYQLTVGFQGFRSAVFPRSSEIIPQSPGIGPLSGLLNSLPTGEEVLYFWSFNEGHLLPDIALIPSGAQVSTQPSPDAYSFTTVGAMAAPDLFFPAGNALSVNGITTVHIRIPSHSIQQLTSLSFHVNVTSTGPKALQISYASNGEPQEEAFVPLVDLQHIDQVNQSYLLEYELSSLPILGDYISLRISFEEGERGSASNYNPTQGRARIDNIRLTGEIDPSNIFPPNQFDIAQLDYHIFDAETGELVRFERLPINGPLGNLVLPIELPRGSYHLHFVYNQSNAPLRYAEPLGHYEDFVVGNAFDNGYAKIYGFLLEDFAVLADGHEMLALTRYYSEIQILFEDNRDFSEIGELLIFKEHDYDYYPIGNPALAQPFAGPQVLALTPYFEFTENSIHFHQFLGLREEAVPLQYRVEVYDKTGDLIRGFTLGETIRNNVQLTFTGKLYDSSDQGFQFEILEDWAEEIFKSF